MNNAHAHALVTDTRMYTTCARNALFELRYAKRSQRYYLHVTNSASVMLDSDSASAVYDAMKRHVVRTLTNKVSVRKSVYVMRSDIRAIVRAVICSKFAH